MNIPEGATHYCVITKTFYKLGSHFNLKYRRDNVWEGSGMWSPEFYSLLHGGAMVKLGVDNVAEGKLLMTADGGLSSSEVDGILTECTKILKERGKQHESHGEQERSFNSVAVAFTAISGIKIEPDHVCLLLGLLKDARQFSQERYHHDSAIDGINYRVLLAQERKERLGGVE